MTETEEDLSLFDTVTEDDAWLRKRKLPDVTEEDVVEKKPRIQEQDDQVVPESQQVIDDDVNAEEGLGSVRRNNQLPI